MTTIRIDSINLRKSCPEIINTRTDDQFYLNNLVQPIKFAAPTERMTIPAAAKTVAKDFFWSTATMMAMRNDILVGYSTILERQMRTNEWLRGEWVSGRFRVESVVKTNLEQLFLSKQIWSKIILSQTQNNFVKLKNEVSNSKSTCKMSVPVEILSWVECVGTTKSLCWLLA